MRRYVLYTNFNPFICAGTCTIYKIKFVVLVGNRISRYPMQPLAFALIFNYYWFVRAGWFIGTQSCRKGFKYISFFLTIEIQSICHIIVDILSTINLVQRISKRRLHAAIICMCYQILNQIKNDQIKTKHISITNLFQISNCLNICISE